MAPTWDEFKDLKSPYQLQAPKYGDAPYYYSVVKDNGAQYLESVPYETVQFRLSWSESAGYGHRDYHLEWLADGKKYGIHMAISLDLIGHSYSPYELADLMAKQFRHQMEKLNRPPEEIKCMYDFLGKLAWGEMKTAGHLLGDPYHYTNSTNPSKFAKGGYIANNYDWETGGYADYEMLSYDQVYQENYRQPEVDILPGVKEVVKHPVNPKFAGAGMKPGYGTIQSIIIDLNDREMWTRDQIADWLETLDIDLTFKDNVDKPGYYKGQKIEYKGSGKLGEKIEHKPTNVTQITPDTFSIQFDTNQIDPKALELMYGGKIISKEELLKEIGGDTE